MLAGCLCVEAALLSGSPPSQLRAGGQEAARLRLAAPRPSAAVCWGCAPRFRGSRERGGSSKQSPFLPGLTKHRAVSRTKASRWELQHLHCWLWVDVQGCPTLGLGRALTNGALVLGSSHLLPSSGFLFPCAFGDWG